MLNIDIIRLQLTTSNPMPFGGIFSAAGLCLSIKQTSQTPMDASSASIDPVNPLGVYDRGTELYSQGRGVAAPREPPEGSSDVLQDYWQNQNKTFNERLSKEPLNVPLWLEFVNFQDRAYIYTFRSEEGNTDKKKKSLNQKALSERKIAILDTAIKKNVKSTELQYERLNIGQHLWDDKKLKQEWGTYLFNFPNKMKVWHQYLAFTQTYFETFNLPSVVKVFAKCTERLRDMQTGSFLTHSPPENLGRCLVDVAVQLAHVWRQGGYLERSVALFQALIEFNLYAPCHARARDVPFETRLVMFEPFWDSRAPRFGEDKSAGWAEVMKNKETIEFPEIILEGTQDEEDELLRAGGGTTQQWLNLEASRERRHWLPWEEDPEDCEDHERMVAFEDLAPHMFLLHSRGDQFYLVQQFLSFLGLEVPEASGSLHIQQSLLFNKEIDNVFQPLNLETLFDEKLFGGQSNFENVFKIKEILGFISIGPTLKNFKCQDFYNFICRVVLQAFDIFEQPYRGTLVSMYIKVLSLRCAMVKEEMQGTAELKHFGKYSKKQVRKLLKTKEFRSDFAVYCDYLKLIETSGDLQEARNVYVITLTRGTEAAYVFDIRNPNFINFMNLITSYIKVLFKLEAEHQNDKYISAIFSALCSLVNEGKFNTSPVQGGAILKARKKLAEMQELYSYGTLIAAKEGPEKELKRIYVSKVVFFLGIIQLFTSGLRAASIVFETFLENARNAAAPTQQDVGAGRSAGPAGGADRRLLEMVYESYLFLVDAAPGLCHRVPDCQMSPTSLRDLLEQAVKLAPHNTMFLLMYVQNQNWRNLLSGKDILGEKNTSIFVRVSQLLPHLQKTLDLLSDMQEGSLSSGYRLESVLEKAVSQVPGSNCPLLWRLYLTLIASTQPKKLKGLVYKALYHCPGVKSIYLDAVRLVPSMLREMLNLMTEKGLRVRLPLEELQILTEAELEFEMDSEPETPTRDGDDDTPRCADEGQERAVITYEGSENSSTTDSDEEDKSMTPSYDYNDDDPETPSP